MPLIASTTTSGGATMRGIDYLLFAALSVCMVIIFLQMFVMLEMHRVCSL